MIGVKTIGNGPHQDIKFDLTSLKQYHMLITNKIIIGNVLHSIQMLISNGRYTVAYKKNTTYVKQNLNLSVEILQFKIAYFKFYIEKK